MAERLVGREKSGLYHRRRRQSEEGKNGDKRIAMVKFIIEEKKKHNKKTQSLGTPKSSVFWQKFWCYPLVV
jgi:hypothetical protein